VIALFLLHKHLNLTSARPALYLILPLLSAQFSTEG